MGRLAGWLFLCLTLCGCATTKVTEARQQSQTIRLARQISRLAPTVNRTEAWQAADAAVRYPVQLAAEWHVTPPAGFNNFLINCHLHPHGLCYEWADALTIRLMALRLKTLEIHRGVARLGTYREHSCVVLTAIGQAFTNGIVLDAWRHGGDLYFGTVTRDQYPWHEVGLTADYQQELENAAQKMRADAPAAQR
jgi:hypothetical protein